MNVRAIIHSSGWVSVVSHNGPSGFWRSQGLMEIKTFLKLLGNSLSELKRLEVRPPRHNEEWEWEVSHNHLVQE